MHGQSHLSASLDTLNEFNAASIVVLKDSTGSLSYLNIHLFVDGYYSKGLDP